MGFGGSGDPGSNSGAFGGEFGRALLRERIGKPLPPASVLDGLMAERRRRRLARFVAIARFFRAVR